MKLSFFISILCFAFLGLGSTLIAQPDTIQVRVSGDTVRYLFFDNDISDRYSYVEIGNYFEKAAAMFTIGEFALHPANGSLTYINFNHPLALPGYNGMAPVPVYQTNSNDYANELITNTFSPSVGDTLSWFLSRMIRYPEMNTDSSERTYEQDTTEFNFPDTTAVILELLDSNNSLITVLDSVITLPYPSYWQFAGAMKDFTYDSTYVSNEPYYLKRFVIPAGMSLGTGPHRIRVVPVHYPQRTQNYSNRALYVSFDVVASPYSLGFMMGADSINARFKALYDSLVAEGEIDKRAVVGGKSVRLHEGAFYPSVVRRGGTLNIVTHLESYKPLVLFELVTITGSVVYSRPITPAVTSERLSIVLPYSVPPGSYYGILHLGDGVVANLLHIMK